MPVDDGDVEVAYVPQEMASLLPAQPLNVRDKPCPCFTCLTEALDGGLQSRSEPPCLDDVLRPLVVEPVPLNPQGLNDALERALKEGTAVA